MVKGTVIYMVICHSLQCPIFCELFTIDLFLFVRGTLGISLVGVLINM